MTQMITLESLHNNNTLTMRLATFQARDERDRDGKSTPRAKRVEHRIWKELCGNKGCRCGCRISKTSVRELGHLL